MVTITEQRCDGQLSKSAGNMGKMDNFAYAAAKIAAFQTNQHQDDKNCARRLFFNANEKKSNRTKQINIRLIA